MNCAGPRSRKTNAQSPRVFRPSACHKSSCFFMTDADEVDTVLAPPQSVNYRVYAVADHSENVSDAPVNQMVHEDVGRCGILAWHFRGLLHRVGSMFAPDIAGACTDG